MAKLTKPELPEHLRIRYNELKGKIAQRLKDFQNCPKELYFYELCFCLCTPQSKAKLAFLVEQILIEKNYLIKPFGLAPLLGNKEHYIRFHNQKAGYIRLARDNYGDIEKIILSKMNNYEKRNLLSETVKGMGMKEASHFLRNIGFRGLAILDRHILKHLMYCGVYDEIPKPTSKKVYLEIEQKFIEFSKSVGIPIDELDLLFWSYETGEILK
ncbi:MAG: N-glycosylase/DNA lyase [Ignavibacteria bacterium]|nr:N-glycosylase/DNA lyase [Ignavibacteria bacterium]